MTEYSTASQWHDCKQLLPEHGERVLVYQSTLFPFMRLTGRVEISTWLRTTGGGLWACDDSPWRLRQVTHWMPLPAAPHDVRENPVDEVTATAPDLLEFAHEVRRTGDTRLASMAIAVIARAEGSA